jgi:cytoskeletal protein CcmA (bactofilin family)
MNSVLVAAANFLMVISEARNRRRWFAKEGIMFALRRHGTVIAEGLKIVGSVTAEGLVEVNGQIDGELHCTSLLISRKAHVTGAIAAERVVVDGSVEGPIQGGEVVLKSHAHVVGDIQHQSLAIEKGAYFEGRSVQAPAENGRQPERVGMRSRQEALKEVANNGRGAVLVS